MNRFFKSVLILVLANSVLLGSVASQETNSGNIDVYNDSNQLEVDSVNNSTFTDKTKYNSNDQWKQDSIYPGEYPGTSGGEVEIDQGLIDTIINMIKGKNQLKVNITSVEYSYSSDESPSIELSLNITGLSGREDFEPSSFFKTTYITDPSGNQCQTKFFQLGDVKVMNSEVERTEEWLKTGMKCHFDEEDDLEDGVYELNLEKSSGEVYTANFNISGYRQVEIPVSDKNITKTMGFYNGNGDLTEDSFLMRNRISPHASQWDAIKGNTGVDMYEQSPRLVVYQISTLIDHKNGIKRFSPKKVVVNLKGPKGEFYPVNKEPVKNSLLNKKLEYGLGKTKNSTIEFLIPAKNYTTGEYTAKFKSNTSNKTYGRTSFELVKEKPKLEFSNPEIKFKEDPWTVEETESWKEQENQPDDVRFLELYVKHLELDVENLGELTGSITDFKYKREGMNSFESWDTKGKNPNKVEYKNPKDISPMEQKTVKLPFGQSMVRWDEYNGPMTILIKTGTGKTFKITGVLSEPVYKCKERSYILGFFTLTLPDCELKEEAEFSNTEITKIN